MQVDRYRSLAALLLVSCAAGCAANLRVGGDLRFDASGRTQLIYVESMWRAGLAANFDANRTDLVVCQCRELGVGRRLGTLHGH
jgi:hypothetical protein